MKRFVAIPLAVALTVLGPGFSAWAESVDAQVSRLAKEGHTKYQAGDYAGAADLMLQAYELKPDAQLLFNLARAYEKANNVDQAIRYYQKYLDREDADPKMMRLANKSLDKLLVQQADQQKAEEAKKEKDDADRKAQADALAEQQKQLAEQQKKTEEQTKALQVERSRPQPPPPAESRGWKYLGGALTAAGVVAAGSGVVFGVLAQQEANTEEKSRDLTVKQNDVKTAQNYAHVADLGYGLGLVMGAVGIGVIVHALRAPDAPTSDAKPASDATPVGTPSAYVIPHGGGLAWSWSL